MGKKMKFPFLFKPTETTNSAASPWPWPTCVSNPKTLSFSASTDGSIYKNINSAYFEDQNAAEFFDTAPADSFFSASNSCDRHLEEIVSCESEICNSDESAVMGGLRSDRLFFQPGESSSILEEARTRDSPDKDGVVILTMDSSDPLVDFRASMEEMVEAHELRDWECLEELLEWYLRVNSEANHGYIVGAFVDLLLRLALASASNNSVNSTPADENCSSSSTTTQNSFASPLSFSSSTYSSASPRLSSRQNEGEIRVEHKADNSSSTSSYNAPSSVSGV